MLDVGRFFRISLAPRNQLIFFRCLLSGNIWEDVHAHAWANR